MKMSFEGRSFQHSNPGNTESATVRYLVVARHLLVQESDMDIFDSPLKI